MPLSPIFVLVAVAIAGLCIGEKKIVKSVKTTTHHVFHHKVKK